MGAITRQHAHVRAAPTPNASQNARVHDEPNTLEQLVSESLDPQRRLGQGFGGPLVRGNPLPRHTPQCLNPADYSVSRSGLHSWTADSKHPTALQNRIIMWLIREFGIQLSRPYQVHVMSMSFS